MDFLLAEFGMRGLRLSVAGLARPWWSHATGKDGGLGRLVAPRQRRPNASQKRPYSDI